VRFATAQDHFHRHKTTSVESGTVYLLQQAALLGDEVANWSQAMLQARDVARFRYSYPRSLSVRCETHAPAS
jgi:hypothetical protein